MIKAARCFARTIWIILLAASYDLLLGYTGVVSFAHTMFFGMGAYGVGLASQHMGRGFGSLLVGSLSGALLEQTTIRDQVIEQGITPFPNGWVWATSRSGG